MAFNKKKDKRSISGLVTRLKLSFFFSILGLLGLLIPRLNLYGFDHELFSGPKIFFYIDVISLTNFFLGLFLMFYYSFCLKPRLKRIEDLGEGQW